MTHWAKSILECNSCPRAPACTYVLKENAISHWQGWRNLGGGGRGAEYTPPHLYSPLHTLVGIASICSKISFLDWLSANTTDANPGVSGVSNDQKNCEVSINTHCQVDHLLSKIKNHYWKIDKTEKKFINQLIVNVLPPNDNIWIEN